MSFEAKVEVESGEGGCVTRQEKQLRKKQKSEFFQEYEQIIGKEHIDELQFSFQHIVLLQSLGIYHHDQPFKQQLSLKLLKSSINSEIMIFEASWGKINQNISIINSAQPSKFHSQRDKQQWLSKGKYSQIYEGLIKGRAVIVKCTSYSLQRQSSSIMMGIRECFLAKIASILKFGPKFIYQYGFDMLIFQNCFEIVMEKCWVCTNPLLREKALEFSSLQHSLHLMHRLGIFHFDVKPENIMFSSTLKKYVFIDYNLSRMREAEFGYKILSTFRGTLDFCYKEMFNLYSVEVKESFIDPYYNDAYALQASLKKIRYQIVQTKLLRETEESIHDEYIAFDPPPHFDFLLVGQLKMQMFLNCWKEACQTMKMIDALEHCRFQEDIINFFQELEPTKQVKVFYQSQIRQTIGDSFALTFLNRLLDLTNYFSIYQIQIKKEIKQLFQDRIRVDLSEEAEMSNNEQNFEQILMNNGKYKFDLLSYSTIFIEYISYTHNLNNVDNEKRSTLSQFYWEEFRKDTQFKEQCLMEQWESDGPIHKAVACITRLCCYYVSNLSTFAVNEKDDSQSVDQKKEKIKNLCYKVIDHLFILDTGSLPFLLDSLSTIFSSEVFSWEEKLLIFLQVKQVRKWTQLRLSPKKGTYRYQVFSQINFLLGLWFQTIKASRSEVNQSLIGIVEDPLLYEKSSFKNSKEDCCATLKKVRFYLRCEYVEQLFHQSQQNKLENIINEIYLEVSIDDRKKIDPILFVLAEHFILHKSEEKYTIIITRIIDNVRDQSVLEDLSIYQNYKCCKQSQNAITLHITCRWKLMQSLPVKDLILHAKQTESSVEEVECQSKAIYLIKSKSQSVQHQNNLKALLLKLIEFLNFYLLDFLREQKVNEDHQPVNLYHLIVCLKILQIASHSHFTENTFQMLESICDRMKCSYCKRELKLFLLIYRLNFIIFYELEGKDEEVIECHDQFEELVSQELEPRSFNHFLFKQKNCKLEHRLALFRFCSLHPVQEFKHKGVGNYFIHLKAINSFDKFFESKSSFRDMIAKTMKILFLTDEKTFFDFLFELSQYMNSNSSHTILCQCKASFSRFVLQYYQEKDEIKPEYYYHPSKTNLYFNSSSIKDTQFANSSQNLSFTQRIANFGLVLLAYAQNHKCYHKLPIFFNYCIIPNCFSPKIQRQLFIKTYKNMHNLSQKLREQIELNLSQIYVFEEGVQRLSLQKRKMTSLTRQICKLNHRIGNVSSLRGYYSKNEARHIKKGILLKKIKKVDFQESYMNIIFCYPGIY